MNARVSSRDEAVMIPPSDGGSIFLYDYSEIINPDNDLHYKGVLPGSQFVNYNDVAIQGESLYASTGDSLLGFDISDLNNIKQILTIKEGIYYNLILTNKRLYAVGGQTLQILEISDLNNIIRIEYPINHSSLVDISVEREYILIGNIGEGEDFYLLWHSLPTKGINKWLLIFLPIGGIILVIAVATYIFVRKKKKKEEKKEEPK
ncbi:MAG: hypothetical protein GF308_00550 [Candidatus Heimdallarchaeota archaeon]|nr:hypothetical protein [Candidatus Heimdallarchaeota archaeon]